MMILIYDDASNVMLSLSIPSASLSTAIRFHLKPLGQLAIYCSDNYTQHSTATNQSRFHPNDMDERIIKQLYGFYIFYPG
ncbi:hypothetical protein L6164_008846 [Bauhinia variegata]|uniref:Uncharacterized protein n=1 Tax=Bauhinia variegata TaxID=167791 RepID=A0ACB9PH63_BAUVA|nr:hypothetical protein L6164_008846 [Bauhinia variegata]